MTYTRSEVDSLVLDRRWEYDLNNRSPPKDSGILYFPPKPVGKSSTGDKVSGWRRRIRLHTNASGAYIVNITKYSGGYGTDYGSFYRNVYSPSTGNVPKLHWMSMTGRLVHVNGSVSLPVPSESANHQALTSLYKQANRAMTAFRSLTAVGEAREALRMLRRPGKDLFEAIGRYIGKTTKSARRIKRPKDRKSFIRNSYLEATYGWAPLTNDVRSAGEALNRRLERWQGNYTRVSGTGTTKTHTYSPTGYGTTGSEFLLTRNWGYNTDSYYSKRYYGEVKSVIPNPTLCDMRLFGVSWADLALTGWELVPYSFVMDYFTNIGDVLESNCIRQDDWAWLTTVIKRRTRVLSANLRPSNTLITTYPGYLAAKGYTRTLQCSPARAEIFEFERYAPLSGPSDLSVRWEIPGVGSRKWLNIAALSVGLKRGQQLVSQPWRR